MKKFLISLIVLVCGLAAMAQRDSTVEVLYNGTTATVSVADNVSQYLTVTQQGAHVSIAQSDSLSTEITYNLSGSSTDGEFYMSGSYKATLELNGLTLTNTTPEYSGAAIHIQNGKRINVTSAVGDGISCNQYFLMESGTVNISGTGDDGIQCDLDGDTSTGITANHEDEDSGNFYIEGGTITINCSAIAAKGIKSAGDIYITDEPVINVTTSGKGTWDEDDLETKAACGISADGNTNNISSNYYSSPKGIKAGVKTQVGNSYTYSGGIVISDGYISVTTSSNNAEGIESKNTLDVTGGEIFVNAYDDGINSGQDMTITGGYVYSRATNNDGIDANGNCYLDGGLVFAIGGTSVSLTYMGGSTGIEEYEMEQYVNDHRVYTIEGRYLGEEVPDNYRGVYIQNGKKHIKTQ